MSGYANRVIRIPFDHLSSDPKTDPIWVVIKNPALLPPRMLRPSNLVDVEAAEDAAGDLPEGVKRRITGAAAEAADRAGKEVMARLVVAWRVYDATTSPEYDPVTGEEIEGTGQNLLPPPSGGNGVPVEQFELLPTEIQITITERFAEAVNPQKGQGAATQKTSSGQPSPSSTEPGAEAQPPLS